MRLLALLLALSACAPKAATPPSSILYECVDICRPWKAEPDTIDGAWLCYCDTTRVAPSMIEAPKRQYKTDALWKGERDRF